MGSVSQLTIGNPAKFTVAPSDALTRQPISNNDNEISDVDAPWSLWDPSVEFVHPSDDTAQDLMDQRDEATYGSDTIDMEVQQPSEASPTQYNASTPETDESDILENPPGSDYQPSDEDETLLPSRTTGKAKTNAENNDSNTPIENLQPSSEASPARFEASTDESHREDVWNREEEEKPVELLRALRSERVHKIGLSLKYLPNLELFEEVSEQLKERGITRSALACEEWWNHNRWYSKYRDLLEPSQPTSTTTTGHITDVSRLDEADAAAQQALDDENDSPRSPAGNKRSQPELESDQEPQSPAKVPKRTQTGTVDKALAVSFQTLSMTDGANSTCRHNPTIPCHKIRLPIKLLDRRTKRVHNKRLFSRK
jgi:hypothetical protein